MFGENRSRGNMKNRFAAIDIGSNAIRYILAEEQNGKLIAIKKIRVPIRLGKDVFLNGLISKVNIRQSIQVFKEFSALNSEFGVQKYRALATSAVREAKNKDFFIKEIQNKSKMQIDVIDGIEEARLVYEAVNAELDLTRRKAILIDVGGGSVEITISRLGKVIASTSLPMGTVRILDQIKKKNLKEAQIHFITSEFVKPISDFFDKHNDHDMNHLGIGTGGNLECMADLKKVLIKKSPSNLITFSELDKVSEILLKMTYQQRIQKLKLRTDRADVIIPAIEIVKLILRQGLAGRLFIPKVGLRDGILQSIYSSSLAGQAKVT